MYSKNVSGIPFFLPGTCTQTGGCVGPSCVKGNEYYYTDPTGSRWVIKFEPVDNIYTWQIPGRSCMILLPYTIGYGNSIDLNSRSSIVGSSIRLTGFDLELSDGTIPFIINSTGTSYLPSACTPPPPPASI